MALVKSGQSVTAGFITPAPGATLADADSLPTAKVVINVTAVIVETDE